MATREHAYFVYILASRSRTLYVGVTRNVRTRVMQHRERAPGSFTARYNINRLVYVERFQYVGNAIAREKEVKDWNRARKIALIESVNPAWEDLAKGWYSSPHGRTADPSAALRDDNQKADRESTEKADREGTEEATAGAVAEADSFAALRDDQA